MDPSLTDEDKERTPAVLEEYRCGKRREEYIRKCVEKTAALRDLLTEGLAACNAGSAGRRRVVAFALSDLLRRTATDDMDRFRKILRNISAGPKRD